MSKFENDTYDVVIIGAGIGGLVCGCYLAKAGMKVLIVEQHNKPGGYCTSFKRRGYTFDAAAHSFGSYRKDGNMRLVLKALNLDERICIRRTTPSDIVITPEHKITFWADIDKTIRELQDSFPKEANNIKNFIQYLTTSRPIDFAALRKQSYKDFLDRYFYDYRIKTILSLPILGNGGLPPSLISAFTGAKIFTEFILDGGYYPEGGMQALPDIIVDRFKELGGHIKLSCLVKKISVINNRVEGAVLEKIGLVRTRYLVSNCDARQTYYDLLGKHHVKKEIFDTIDSLTPSLSTFILYVAVDKPFKSLPKPGTNVWFLPYYDLEKAYSYAKKGNIDKVEGFMVRFSPDKKTILAFVNAPFKNKVYWDKNKSKLQESFIQRIEKYVIPDLSKHIVYKETATPHTLYRYTLNYQGAAYGWASTPSQLFTPELRQSTSIRGLYLTGHWTTQTQGIPGVAYLGLDTAKFILRKEILK
ncbi:MAG TPA: NAD(P)/FAD-dependent oxidoreductase [Nitrospirota bacterium]|nr:NAD(P)/FAD-dependent oxidoreductase [Nitrospirota bacterium]